MWNPPPSAHLRPAIVERQHVGAKRRLQRRKAIELVQHDIRHSIALQFDHDAETVAIGFIAQICNAVDLLVVYQFSDARDHARLVQLIWNFRDDDTLAVLADGFYCHLATHYDRAAAEVIGRTDALSSQNDAARRKIRPGNDVDE